MKLKMIIALATFALVISSIYPHDGHDQGGCHKDSKDTVHCN